jgi:hypothetical protein
VQDVEEEDEEIIQQLVSKENKEAAVALKEKNEIEAQEKINQEKKKRLLLFLNF